MGSQARMVQYRGGRVGALFSTTTTTTTTWCSRGGRQPPSECCDCSLISSKWKGRPLPRFRALLGATKQGQSGPAAMGCLFSPHPFEAGYLLGDVAILVDVIEVEGPVQLFMHRTPQQDGEANDKVLQEKGAQSGWTGAWSTLGEASVPGSLPFARILGQPSIANNKLDHLDSSKGCH